MLASGAPVLCWVTRSLPSLGMWVLAAHQQFPLAYTGMQGLALGYGRAALVLYSLSPIFVFDWEASAPL